jgi:murein DD-endopeptidase MepM/ murein hydrolase activator NlpD
VRPTLTNDFVIISEAPPSRSLSAAKASAAAANIPSIWPVVGVLRGGVGIRSNPFGGSSLEFHKGQDISAPTGAPVNATADGVVVIARWMRGYGNGIYIDHGNGISTRYGHLSRIDVVEGQIVKRGDHLGLVGSTGRSTGPHLHYEVRLNGQPVSPLPYLPPSPIQPSAERSLQH